MEDGEGRGIKRQCLKGEGVVKLISRWYIWGIKEVTYMAKIKEQVIQMIQALPDEVSIDEIMAELYFRLQVDAGLKELDGGKGIPHEEVEKRMAKWLTA